MRKNKFLIFYLLMLLVLNSCGFQLRKPVDLVYQSYSIIGEPSPILIDLRRQLSFTDIKETKSDNAELVIEILNSNYAKRILSLAGNGQVGEFELIQTVEYRLKINGQWSKTRKLEAIREYTYDPTLYNAAAAEESLLKASMKDQLSRSLISEISNLGK